LPWIREHLCTPLTVGDLAAQACMSERNFARAFVAELGMTPAKAVEKIRLEVARELIETGTHPFDAVAETSGFRDTERMRKAFLRHFGQPPQALRRTARGAAPPAAR